MQHSKPLCADAFSAFDVSKDKVQNLITVIDAHKSLTEEVRIISFFGNDTYVL